MIDMKKVMVVVGTRPELIRLCTIIKKLPEFFETVLVHTGQNYDYTLNKIFFEDLGIRKPDYYMDSPGSHLGETIGNIISKGYEILQQEKPDALLILGDTNSGLVSIPAKRLKIPIFHMEAGNRCFDMRVPEEINRKIIDHVSDINLAYTENARRYLIHEGVKNDFLYVTGSPMAEVLHVYQEQINSSTVLNKLGLNEKEYFVVSAHREENLELDEHFSFLCDSLNQIAETYHKPLIFSTHPRTEKKIKSKDKIFNPLVRMIAPLGFFDYVKLQKNSFCVLSDSGTVPEEAAILNFPAVSIRTSTERPEALDAGNIVLGGVEKDSVLSAIKIAIGFFDENRTTYVADYQDTNVSEKVIKIIQSYMGIVNARIWKK